MGKPVFCVFAGEMGVPGIEPVARRGAPFQGPRVGFCLTLGNGLSEETHVLGEQKALLGRGTRAERSGLKEPRRTALPRGSQSLVLW